MPSTLLPGSDGVAHRVPGAALTVLVFFSPTCAYQTSHDGRIRDLYRDYSRRGVDFFVVDSESSGSLERDQREAQSRRYPFPILRDERANLARALGARYASYAVIVDREGRTLYGGAIDGDRVQIRTDTPPYLRNAIDSLLAGRMPPVTQTEAPGCALQTW